MKYDRAHLGRFNLYTSIMCYINMSIVYVLRDMFHLGISINFPLQGSPPEVIVLSRRVFSPSGRNVKFHVQVRGTPPFTTVWSKLDGHPLADGHRIDPRTHGLTLSDVSEEDAGRYIITVSNPYGTVMGETQLDVQCAYDTLDQKGYYEWDAILIGGAWLDGISLW